jgi:hypothetical protein
MLLNVPGSQILASQELRDDTSRRRYASPKARGEVGEWPREDQKDYPA